MTLREGGPARKLLARRALCYPGAVRSPLPLLLAVGSSLALCAAAAPARADASAWMFVGGGVLAWKQGKASNPTADNNGTFSTSGMMTIDVGVGTSPDAPFIFGGLFRIKPIFQHGADLGLMARGATRGFQEGGFGVAIDAGGYLRTWGPEIGAGFTGGLSAGLPLGFTLTAQVEVGTNNAFGFGAVAGLDLARLTVYRRTLLKWWQNPQPSWNRTARAGRQSM